MSIDVCRLQQPCAASTGKPGHKPPGERSARNPPLLVKLATRRPPRAAAAAAALFSDARKRVNARAALNMRPAAREATFQRVDGDESVSGSSGGGT